MSGTIKHFYVYILASGERGTLYIGMTNDLLRRVHEHRLKQVEGFTKQYSVRRLVYYEIHQDAMQAITREKQLKKWRRSWKLRLIEEQNPRWKDLYDELTDDGTA